MFIYTVTNDVNDKAYVGLFSGTNLGIRWSRHKFDARNGSTIPLHRAMARYGINKFHIIKIWSGDFPGVSTEVARRKLAELEKYFIKCFRTRKPNGYNLTAGGDGSVGFKHSEEYKRSLRGRFFSPETRLKMSLVHKGKTISQKHRDAISVKMRGNQHLLGYIPTEETRRKLSIAGKNHHRSKGHQQQ